MRTSNKSIFTFAYHSAVNIFQEKIVKVIERKKLLQKSERLVELKETGRDHVAIVEEVNEAEKRLLGMPSSITGAWPSIP